MSDTELHHLLNRAIDGVVLHGESDRLRELVRGLEQRAKEAEADHARVQRQACRTAELLRHAEGRGVKAAAAVERARNLAIVWDDAPDPLAQAMARDLRAAINGPRCTHCGGDGADPEDPGDYDTTVHMHNPYTRGPCPVCNGTKQQSITA